MSTDKQLEDLRDKLYHSLPTGKIESFDLIRIINTHLKDLDAYIEWQKQVPVKKKIPQADLTGMEWMAENPQPQVPTGLPLDLNNAWPTKDVLSSLIWATEYLLNKKSYDGHNHEELLTCVNRGKEILENIGQVPTPVAKSAEEILKSFQAEDMTWDELSKALKKDNILNRLWLTSLAAMETYKNQPLPNAVGGGWVEINENSLPEDGKKLAFYLPKYKTITYGSFHKLDSFYRDNIFTAMDGAHFGIKDVSHYKVILPPKNQQ